MPLSLHSWTLYRKGVEAVHSICTLWRWTWFLLYSLLLLVLVVLQFGEGRMEVWTWWCCRQTLLRGVLCTLWSLESRNAFSWVLRYALTRHRHDLSLNKAWFCKECSISLAITESGRFLVLPTQFGLFGCLRLPDVEISGRCSSSFWWFFFRWSSLLSRCRFFFIWRRK